MNFGNWDVNVSFDSMPQPVATAMAGINDTMIGAEYDFITYLGSQTVNGTNYAVLAKQVLTTGRDTQNVVLLKFNQKPGDINANLVGIEHVLDSGGPLGGAEVNPQTDIPTTAQQVWLNAFEGYVGVKVKPLAFLGTQIVNGLNHFYIAEISTVTADPKKDIVLVVINPVSKSCTMTSVFETKASNALGYAFTW